MTFAVGEHRNFLNCLVAKNKPFSQDPPTFINEKNKKISTWCTIAPWSFATNQIEHTPKAWMTHFFRLHWFQDCKGKRAKKNSFTTTWYRIRNGRTSAAKKKSSFPNLLPLRTKWHWECPQKWLAKVTLFFPFLILCEKSAQNTHLLYHSHPNDEWNTTATSSPNQRCDEKWQFTNNPVTRDWLKIRFAFKKVRISE